MSNASSEWVLKLEEKIHHREKLYFSHRNSVVVGSSKKVYLPFPSTIIRMHSASTLPLHYYILGLNYTSGTPVMELQGLELPASWKKIKLPCPLNGGLMECYLSGDITYL